MNTRPRLLIVDDEPINIQTLYQIFREDYEVFMATSGEQAIHWCQQTQLPDLILLDVVMPDMDGHEVCRQLKADATTADIPIIFVTAQLDPADETRALEVGGVDFISKPVNPAVVRARVMTHLRLKAQADLLKAMAFVDGLTGVGNRRRLDEALQREWYNARRNHKPLTLMMIDVDHFKRYNDFYGHQKGDVCLKSVADIMQQQLNNSREIIARYGGEEFICLLPECPLTEGKIKAESLRHAVEILQISHAESLTSNVITVSIGVATLYPDEHGEEQLLAAADAALYHAKHTGRNRVCAWQDKTLNGAALNGDALKTGQRNAQC